MREAFHKEKMKRKQPSDFLDVSDGYYEDVEAAREEVSETFPETLDEA